MSTSRFERFLPYSGVLAGVLFVVTMFGKYAQEYGDPAAATIIKDHGVQNVVAAVAMALCCTALLFFAAAVRSALRSGESGESTYSSIAFGAAVLIALSKALDAQLLFAGIGAAGEDDLRALHTLAYLGDASWLPWVAASAAFYLATGVGGLRTAALPKWLAVVTLVLGVACLLGPAGVAVYMVTPAWLIVTGIALGRRQPARTTERLEV